MKKSLSSLEVPSLIYLTVIIAGALIPGSSFLYFYRDYDIQSVYLLNFLYESLIYGIPFYMVTVLGIESLLVVIDKNTDIWSKKNIENTTFVAGHISLVAFYALIYFDQTIIGSGGRFQTLIMAYVGFFLVLGLISHISNLYGDRS